MKKRRLLIQPSFSLELLSRLELPNLILTKDRKSFYSLFYLFVSCHIAVEISIFLVSIFSYLIFTFSNLLGKMLDKR